jgi:hypothetical protein
MFIYFDKNSSISIIGSFMLISALLMVPFLALAHVPYLEHQDYSEEQPFKVEDSIENSKAVYAWLRLEKMLTYIPLR